MKKILGIFIAIFLMGTSLSLAKEKEKYASPSKLDIINYDWWLGFNDVNLNRHILNALKNNSDLKIAEEKLVEYRNFAKSSLGAELPTVSAGLSGYKADHLPVPAIVLKDHGVVLPITVNYEADLFFKNRNKTQSINKQVEAYELQLQSTYIILVSNLSTIYFNAMQINKALELQDRMLVIKKDALNDVKSKFVNGVASEIDLNKATQDVKSIEIRIDELEKVRVELLTQLALMTGTDINNFDNLKISKIENVKSNVVPNGIKSDIIFCRPDVLVQEKQMERAKIDVKIARKEFLPTIDLTGAMVFNNLGRGSFFSLNETIFALVGGITAPLFTGGQRLDNLRIMKSRQEQILETYRNVTLQAVKEVNDSVYTVKYNGDILDNNNSKFELEKNNYEHYKNMYGNGLIAEVDLQNLEQKLIAEEMDLASAKVQQLIGFVSLYMATGGQLNNN